MSRDRVIFMGGSGGGDVNEADANHFTAQNTFDLFPIVPISTAGASAAMVAGTRYKYTLTAALTATSFTGTVEGSKIVVDLLACSGSHTFTFPASYRKGDANSTSTSITPTAGNHMVVFEYITSSWYYTDTFATTTLTNYSVSGALTLTENASLALDPAGSADGKYSGITVTGTGGATIAFGDLVTLDKDDSRWELVDISVAAAATGDARGILGIAVTSSTDGGALTVLLQGIVRADANFPALTIGAPVYASTTGDVVVTQPTTTDHVIRIVGYGMTADELYFAPAGTWTTHT